jgi:tetratricopeptide (TPR) repeat protein
LLTGALAVNLEAQQLEPMVQDDDLSSASVDISQIYNLTEVAKTAEDFERIVVRSEKLLDKTIFDKDKKYLNSLIGWSRNRLAQIHIKTAESMKEMGLIEQAHRRIDQATEQFDTVIEKHPGVWRAWLGRANIHAASGQYEQALAKYIEVTKRKRDYMPAWFNCAELALQLDKHEDAIKYYSRVIGEDASDVQARTGRAHSLLAVGKTEQAIEEYKTVTNLQAGDEQALCNLGDAYSQSENWEDALAVYEQASKLPKATLGLERLANFLCSCPDKSLMDTERAVTSANMAIENGTAKAEYLSTLAAAYTANGQTDLASEIKARIEKLNVNNTRQAKLPTDSSR